jgi:glucokinase
MILAADITTETTELVLVDASGSPIRSGAYRTREHGSVVAMLRTFLRAHRVDVESAGIAVSTDAERIVGPVLAHELAEILELPRVVVSSRIEAVCHSLDRLCATDLRVLVAGQRPAFGNRTVLLADEQVEEGVVWRGQVETRHGEHVDDPMSLGARAGLLAVTTYAAGGLYLAGSAVRKVLAGDMRGFLRAYAAATYVDGPERFPVRLVETDRAVLLGAAVTAGAPLVAEIEARAA